MSSRVPRGANILRRIFHDHFPAFVQSYDSHDAQGYGKFRLERISRVAERFESCSDYTPAAILQHRTRVGLSVRMNEVHREGLRDRPHRRQLFA